MLTQTMINELQSGLQAKSFVSDFNIELINLETYDTVVYTNYKTPDGEVLTVMVTVITRSLSVERQFFTVTAKIGNYMLGVEYRTLRFDHFEPIFQYGTPKVVLKLVQEGYKKMLESFYLTPTVFNKLSEMKIA